MIELWIQQKNIAALLLAALFVAVLLLAALSDIRTATIPNRYSAIIFFLSLASVFVISDIPVFSRCIGAICISVPMLLLACFYTGAFGGGDIKLMAACGAFLGWKGVTLSMGIAVLTGGAVCVILLLTGKKGRKEQIAFGPFLCAGLIVALLFGNRLWEGLFAAV